jgi:uncharacterized protein (DUF1800 family)
MRSIILIALLAASGADAQATRARPTSERRAAAPREDTARAVHLLERATWGVRRDDLAEVLRIGPDAWLERQLHPERIDDAALPARLARFPAATASPSQLMRDYPRTQAARRDSAARPARDTSAARRRPARILADLAGARLQRAVYTERQLEDVMADFWYNHFNVFFGKGADRYLVGDYERAAIRPHVFGRFRDLLGATAAHPPCWCTWTTPAAPPPTPRRR